MRLSELIAGAPAVAMLGLCKNAGKTTAMNRMIRELAEAGRPRVAMTSIGRDGESRDLVTGTEKPPIWIYEGMLAATATQLLPVCDASRELLELTGLHTSLGEVAVFRARSDGFVQLAGPAMVEQLGLLRRKRNEYGAECVLIDGALSRRSPAAAAADGVCILSAGASLDRDLERVVAETAYAARLLCLPKEAAPGAAKDRLTLFLEHEAPEGRGFSDFPALIDALRRARRPGTVLLTGGFSEAQARALLQSGAAGEGLRLLTEDGSRLLLRRETFEALKRRGLRFAVLRGARLAAVTVNPVSAGGWRFDADELLERTQAAVAVPVLDVMR